VVSRLPEQARAILEIITLLGGIWIMVFLTWAGVQSGIDSIQYRTMYLKLPELPFRVILALSYATLFLATMLVITRKIMELVKR
jgi:TRAP-type C4-dicarboxylate transport system permease small subunit